jgi:hypothetical protein
MNKTKMIALPLIAIMLSLTTAVAVAHWVDNLYVVGEVQSGELSACVYIASTLAGNDWTCDPGLKNVRQLDKDIANSNVTFTCDTVTVTVNNGYPCYYDHVDIGVENTGTIPWAIWKVVIWTDYSDAVTLYTPQQYMLLNLTDDGLPDMELRWGNSFGDQFDPGTMADLSFEFHLLNPIPQGATCLQFYAQIYIVNWNEYEAMLPPGVIPQ